MPNVNNVSTGKPKVAGAIFRAPKGTALPTDANTPLSAAFSEMGYVSEDGVTNSNSPSSEKVKDWGGQTVLIVFSDKPDTIKVKFLESLNPNVLETVYGEANVTVNAAVGTISIKANASELDEYVYVIDMSMRGGALKRIVIPAGSLSELGDIVYKNNEPVGYEVTLECMPNDEGDTHYEYIKLASGTSMSLSLDKTTLSVAAGATAQIAASTTPAGLRVTWGTSDASKATVDQSGLVTGVAAGSATITSTMGGLTKSCTVTVTS